MSRKPARSFRRVPESRPIRDLYRAASFVLHQNLIHGDALTIRTAAGEPITFAEWGYLGKGVFQRRDFRFESLAQMSTLRAEGMLFADPASTKSSPLPLISRA